MESIITESELILKEDGKEYRKAFLSEEIQKDSRYSLYLYVETEYGKCFAKFGEAKKSTVWDRYIHSISNANKKMIKVWESDKGDKEIHKVLKESSSNGVGFTWAGNKEDSAINTEEAYEIHSIKDLELLISEIDEETKSKGCERNNDETFADIITLTSQVLRVHSEGAKTFILDLCTRWGKTRTILESLKSSECRVCFMCSYVGTVKASYEKEINSQEAYKDMVFVDPDNFKSAEERVEYCKEILKDKSKKIMYYVALTGTFNEFTEEMEEGEEDITSFGRRTDKAGLLKKYKCMMVVEEADFGASCPKQTKKIGNLFNLIDCKFMISTTGTNIEKTIAITEKLGGDFVYFKRDYLLDVLKSTCRLDKNGNNTAVGIEWNILNNVEMVQEFGYSIEEMENYSDFFKIEENGHFSNEAYIADVLRFLFGKNREIEHPKNTRKIGKVFTNPDMKKEAVTGQKPAWMFFTPSGYDTHETLKTLIETYFPECLVKIIDGKYTTNDEAENLAKHAIADGAKKDKRVIFIASGMANRSFSVKQIKNIVLFTNAGSYSSIAQKIARGLTPWDADHSINHIFDFRLNYESESNLTSYLSGLGGDTLDGKTTQTIETLIEAITGSEKLTFNEYFQHGVDPLHKLTASELDSMMRTMDFRKKELLNLQGMICSLAGKPERGESLNEKLDTLKDIFGTNVMGDKSREESYRTSKQMSKEDTEIVKAEKDLRNLRWQHYLFLVNNFEAVFNSYEYEDHVLENTFKNMSDETKKRYEDLFDLDMNFMQEIVDSLVENKKTEYFDVTL